MNYSEKLKDPRWQKKRLEIMQRDEFTCQWCGCTEKTLNVHHIRYKSEEPWDEESVNLITICEDCHTEEHNRRNDENSFIESIKAAPFNKIMRPVHGLLLKIKKQTGKTYYVPRLFMAISTLVELKGLDHVLDLIYREIDGE